MMLLQNAMQKIMFTQKCELTSGNFGVSHSEVFEVFTADIVWLPFFLTKYIKQKYISAI